MRSRSGLVRFVRFAAVGLVGTVAHYALLVALVEGGGVKPLPGSIAGFLLGALVNYTFSRRFVFDSDRSHVQALPRFMAVAGMGLCWNALLMYLLADRIGLHYLLAQMLTTGLLLCWHYVGNAVWTFGRGKAAKSATVSHGKTP